jgi:very-short-patch-repair endonuclease
MKHIRRRARELRNNPTDAERSLWIRLRLWQIDGYKFRRQQPIGRYIVSFVCFEKRVVIEVDGGQYAEQVTLDGARERRLKEQGFTVLRFWNHGVLKNIAVVKEVIFKNLSKTPTLVLPHKGEGDWGGGRLR